MKTQAKQQNQKADLIQLSKLLKGEMWCVTPKKISLLGEMWTIEATDSLPANINGNCSYKDKLIKIKSHKNSFRTLLHELNHARSKIFGYKWNETEVRLNAMFDMQVYEQILTNPISKLWLSMDKDLQIETESAKDLEIKKLKAQIKKLKNKLEAR